MYLIINGKTSLMEYANKALAGVSEKTSVLTAYAG